MLFDVHSESKKASDRSCGRVWRHLPRIKGQSVDVYSNDNTSNILIMK